MDPSKGNGGVLLGLNGVVIKSHGGTHAEGFAAAVDVGYDMVRYDLLTKINQTLNRDGSALASRRSVRGCLVTVTRSIVLGGGAYLPERVVTNDELANRVDTSDEWIVQRTGISSATSPPMARPPRSGTQAADRALANAGADAQSIDLIIVAHLDARLHVPGDRGADPARSGSSTALRSTFRRCARASSSRRDRR